MRNREIRTAEDSVLTGRKGTRTTGLFFSLPGILRRLIWRMLLRSPFSSKRNMGTVIVTNIGMAGMSGLPCRVAAEM